MESGRRLRSRTTRGAVPYQNSLCSRSSTEGKELSEQVAAVAARPGWPEGLPGDSTRAFARDRLGFVTRLAAERGDFVPFRVARERIVLASHPEIIEEVVVSPKARDFSKDYLTSLFPPLIRRNLLLADPDSWLAERHLAQPAFHHDRLLAYAPIMTDEAERLAADWRDGESVDVSAATRRLTVLILCRALFDVDLRRQARRAAGLIDLVLDEIDERASRMDGAASILPSLRDVRLFWGIAQLEHVLGKVMKERRSGTDDRLDLLTSLVRDGDRLDDAQLRKVVVPLFFAGHETTAMALAWALYLLAAHPQAQRRVVEEIDQAVGDGPVTAEAISKLTFTGAVFSETLRLYPPIWAFGRRAVKPTEVAGYEIPVGTVIFMSQWVLHRDARWFDRAPDFVPERWLDGLHRRLPRGVFIPFGSGSRRCLGGTFANWEAALCLAAIVRRFELAPEGPPPAPKPSFTLRPVNLTLKVRRR